jgi:hypothetical protein
VDDGQCPVYVVVVDRYVHSLHLKYIEFLGPPAHGCEGIPLQLQLTNKEAVKEVRGTAGGTSAKAIITHLQHAHVQANWFVVQPPGLACQCQRPLDSDCTVRRGEGLV